MGRGMGKGKGKGRGAALATRAALAISVLITPLTAGAEGMPPARGESLAGRLLAAHNGERERLGLQRFVWSAKLAADAQAWADELASTETFRHASQRSEGENLWGGSTDHYGPEDMIGAFLAESREFRPGVFPNVSTSGSWQRIGHYTQVIWPTTQQLGCALARGRSRDVLVCRYWPAGNVIGMKVG